MSIDYSLLDRLSKSSAPTGGALSHYEPCQAPQTAFGRRVVALSQAFHSQSMSDEEIESYLVELVDACENQWSRVEAVRGCKGEKNELIDFLEGVIEVAENFDLMSHNEVEAAVAELEDGLRMTVVHLTTRVAA